jgi:SAM-dependent methyltransferase
MWSIKIKMNDEHITNDFNFFKKASFVDVAKINAYIVKLNLKKKNRTPEVIDNEYNSGYWNRDFEDIEFETFGGNYNRDDIDEIQIFPINNQLRKMKRREFFRRYEIEFLTFFNQIKNQEIVELGCGLGTNLFCLYNAGFKKLSGSDISKNAIKNLRKYVKTKEIDINFEVVDLNQKLPDGIIKNKIVFTHTCLEQCKHIMPNVLKNIVDGQPKAVMNIEVDYNSAPNMVKKYFDARDYQNNLVNELKKLENENIIRDVKIRKMFYGGSSVNRHSLITWTPGI